MVATSFRRVMCAGGPKRTIHTRQRSKFSRGARLKEQNKARTTRTRATTRMKMRLAVRMTRQRKDERVSLTTPIISLTCERKQKRGQITRHGWRPARRRSVKWLETTPSHLGVATTPDGGKRGGRGCGQRLRSLKKHHLHRLDHRPATHEARERSSLLAALSTTPRRTRRL